MKRPWLRVVYSTILCTGIGVNASVASSYDMLAGIGPHFLPMTPSVESCNAWRDRIEADIKRTFKAHDDCLEEKAHPFALDGPKCAAPECQTLHERRQSLSKRASEGWRRCVAGIPKERSATTPTEYSIPEDTLRPRTAPEPNYKIDPQHLRTLRIPVNPPVRKLSKFEESVKFAYDVVRTAYPKIEQTIERVEPFARSPGGDSILSRVQDLIKLGQMIEDMAHNPHSSYDALDLSLALALELNKRNKHRISRKITKVALKFTADVFRQSVAELDAELDELESIQSGSLNKVSIPDTAGCLEINGEIACPRR